MKSDIAVRLHPIYDGHREILEVPLNPAFESNENGHYFSGEKSQYHWDLWSGSGLITKEVKIWEKCVYADDLVFRGNSINYQGWHYGIHDLAKEYVESKSSEVPVEPSDCACLAQVIKDEKPDVVVLLGKRVQKIFLRYLGYSKRHPANFGEVGKLIADYPTNFFLLAFPSERRDDRIPREAKIDAWIKIREYLEKIH